MMVMHATMREHVEHLKNPPEPSTGHRRSLQVLKGCVIGEATEQLGKCQYTVALEVIEEQGVSRINCSRSGALWKRRHQGL